MPADPPLTKRQLGWLFVAAGLLLGLGALAADLAGAGRFGGLGPAQQRALLGAAAVVAFGFSLVRLGNRLA